MSLSTHHLRTQVAIMGAGPAGLMLARLLRLAGIDSVVLETRSRDYVEARVRAGVLEQGSVDLLDGAGVGARMRAEGIVHDGIYLQFEGARHHMPFTELTGGRSIVIYGQTEVVKDLIADRVEEGLPLYFEVSDTSVQGFETTNPSVGFSHGGERFELDCDVIAGCDGFHGVCREAVADQLDVFTRDFSYGWLGILAAVAPSSDELVYSNHERGFALLSLRSPEISRLYVECAADDDIANWPDARIWEELHIRLGLDGWSLNEGPVLEKGITGMRCFVAEPMRVGRLFLAGDAAHIVPPTGAKGLNLALADVTVLAQALTAWYQNGSTTGLDEYSATCLKRVWRAEHFSNFMTSMLHDGGRDPFTHRLQLSQMRYVTASRAAARSLAENYVGLPSAHFTDGAVTSSRL